MQVDLPQFGHRKASTGIISAESIRLLGPSKEQHTRRFEGIFLSGRLINLKGDYGSPQSIRGGPGNLRHFQ
jgi:hypothetical protein